MKYPILKKISFSTEIHLFCAQNGYKFKKLKVQEIVENNEFFFQTN